MNLDAEIQAAIAKGGSIEDVCRRLAERLLRFSPLRISPANTASSVAVAMSDGTAVLRPDIDHCRDCERAYEMGTSAIPGHPLMLEVKRKRDGIGWWDSDEEILSAMGWRRS